MPYQETDRRTFVVTGYSVPTERKSPIYPFLRMKRRDKESLLSQSNAPTRKNEMKTGHGLAVHPVACIRTQTAAKGN